MRPHNGWWKTTSTPRRWIEAIRAQDPRQAEAADVESQVQKLEPQPVQAAA